MKGSLRRRFSLWIKVSQTRRKIWAAIKWFFRPLGMLRDWIMTGLVILMIGALRLLGPDRSANLGGAIARGLGKIVPAARIGRINLKAAFPEKSDEDIERIFDGVLDNLGRVGGEFVHLEKLYDFDPEKPNTGRIEISPETEALFVKLRDDGKPAIIFSAHLGNWELGAVAAAAHNLDTAIVFRPPNSRAFEKLFEKTRSSVMRGLIRSERQSSFAMMAALEQGRHLGVLIDQYFERGVPVTFFGRQTVANPLAARLARNVDCPVHGARVIRLPEGRFRLELTDEIALPRDAEGKIDVPRATQAMTSVVEGWIREHPEQWLWLHRRWRKITVQARMR